jgi:hypothetical protein
MFKSLCLLTFYKIFGLILQFYAIFVLKDKGLHTIGKSPNLTHSCHYLWNALPPSWVDNKGSHCRKIILPIHIVKWTWVKECKMVMGNLWRTRTNLFQNIWYGYCHTTVNSKIGSLSLLHIMKWLEPTIRNCGSMLSICSYFCLWP